MKRRPCFIYILIQLFLFPVCKAQEPVKISNTELGLKDSMIVIDYDLEGKNAGDLFAVRIEVVDENGKLIHAEALSGDVGENVTGGKTKQILWDYQADSLFIDADISITVFATLTFDATPQVAVVEDQKIEEPIQSDVPNRTDLQQEATIASKSNQFNRAGLIAQSIAFPGLGLSKVSGNPHWIKGIAGYGCVAGSLIFNNKSNKTEDLFDSSTRTDWRTYYHEKSVWQYNMSLTFAAVAAAILNST